MSTKVGGGLESRKVQSDVHAEKRANTRAATYFIFSWPPLKVRKTKLAVANLGKGKGLMEKKTI